MLSDRFNAKDLSEYDVSKNRIEKTLFVFTIFN